MLELVNHPTKLLQKIILPSEVPNKVLEITPSDRSSIVTSGFDKKAISNLPGNSLQFIEYLRTNIMLAAEYLLNESFYPFQGAFISEMFKKRFIILLLTRGGSKSYSMAAYAILRAVLFPPQEIICVSLTFRQIKKGIFKYIEDFYNNSPILQEISDGVSHNRDYYEIKFGASTIIGLPLGEGGSIRGFRSTCTMVDERASVPLDAINVVIRGFGAVSSRPMEKSIRLARIEELLNAGCTKEEVSNLFKEDFNQLIMAGTASYQFNSFYNDYVDYLRVIEEGHDRKKLAKLLKDKVDEESLLFIEPEDFCVIKIPYTKMPEGFMEMKSVTQSRISMDKSQFAAEYECVTSDFPIHCVEQFKFIPQVNVGDLVMCHDGTFRSVKRKYSREYKGPMILISTGCATWTSVEYFTLGHGIFTTKGKVKSEDIRVGDYLVYPLKRPNVDCTELEGKPVNDAFLRIVAKYIAKGKIDIYKGIKQLIFINLTYKMSQELRGDLQEIFACKVYLKRNGNEACRNVYISDKLVVDYFTRNFGEQIESMNLPRCLANLPNEKTSVLLDMFIKSSDKIQDENGVRIVVQNTELGLLIADLLLRNEILVRTYRRVGHYMEFGEGINKKVVYVPPRLIMRFVTPSDLIHIKDGYLYTKVTALDRRNEVHTVFNLEVDGPEHSYCGGAIICANCEFPMDSDGFYKRTLIESCLREYGVKLTGSRSKQYVLALDPARAIDRAAFVLVELGFGEPNQLVYVWSTREDEILDEEIAKDSKYDEEKGMRKKRYYKILADKIRNLCKRFNVVRVVIDNGGGGDKVKEELQDPPAGELPFWEASDETTINYKGHRILVMRNWTADWIGSANHRMRANMEQKRLVFPKFGITNVNKLLEKVDGDEYDRIIYEMGELVNELTSIVVSQTQSGTKEKFGLPKRVASLGEVKVAEWKDRYAALLMADYEASEMTKPLPQYQYNFCGGSLDDIYATIQNHSQSSTRINVDRGLTGNQVIY